MWRRLLADEYKRCYCYFEGFSGLLRHLNLEHKLRDYVYANCPAAAAIRIRKIDGMVEKSAIGMPIIKFGRRSIGLEESCCLRYNNDVVLLHQLEDVSCCALFESNSTPRIICSLGIFVLFPLIFSCSRELISGL